MHISKLLPLIIVLSILFISGLSASSNNEDQKRTELVDVNVSSDETEANTNPIPSWGGKHGIRERLECAFTMCMLLTIAFFVLLMAGISILPPKSGGTYAPSCTNQTDSNCTFF